MSEGPVPVLHEEAPSRAPRPALGYALVWIGVLFWSVNAVVAKIVIHSAGISALRLAEVRATGSAVLLLALVALLRRPQLRITRAEVPVLAVFGVLGLAFVQFFYFVAISRLEIGIALVIEYLAPVLVALWARFVVREPTRRRVWLAIALALAGLALVVDLPAGVTLDGLGVAAALSGAFAYALYILIADRQLERGRDSWSLLGWGFVFAAVFWAVVQPWWTFPWQRVSGDASLLGRFPDLAAPTWLLLAYVVALGTVVPFVCIVSALHHVSPTRVTVVAMLEPVFAALAAFLWLGEELSAQELVGGALVLVAVGIVQTTRAAPGSGTRAAPR